MLPFIQISKEEKVVCDHGKIGRRNPKQTFYRMPIISVKINNVHKSAWSNVVMTIQICRLVHESTGKSRFLRFSQGSFCGTLCLFFYFSAQQSSNLLLYLVCLGHSSSQGYKNGSNLTGHWMKLCLTDIIPIIDNYQPVRCTILLSWSLGLTTQTATSHVLYFITLVVTAADPSFLVLINKIRLPLILIHAFSILGSVAVRVFVVLLHLHLNFFVYTVLFDPWRHISCTNHWK